MADRYHNYYRCPECKHEWEDYWDCGCDDECPECGCRNISPYNSVKCIEDPNEQDTSARTRRPGMNVIMAFSDFRLVGCLSADEYEGAEQPYPHGWADLLQKGLRFDQVDVDLGNEEMARAYVEHFVPGHADAPRRRVKCVRVEHDPDYWGGDYSDVGQFAYIPWEVLDRLPGNDHDAKLKTAFTVLVGDPRHIVHYAFDEPTDQDGNEWREEDD
jgi:hypothetical protein